MFAQFQLPGSFETGINELRSGRCQWNPSRLKPSVISQIFSRPPYSPRHTENSPSMKLSYATQSTLYNCAATLWPGTVKSRESAFTQATGGTPFQRSSTAKVGDSQ